LGPGDFLVSIVLLFLGFKAMYFLETDKKGTIIS